VLLYAAAVAAETGEQPVRAQLLYLGQKIVATAVTPVEIGDAVEQLTSTWNAIGDACHADDFSARPGPLCGYCPYVERCPEGQAENRRRSEMRVAEDEYLERLAG
jgi:putative RecB family exonuclease